VSKLQLIFFDEKRGRGVKERDVFSREKLFSGFGKTKIRLAYQF
jgi:predicted RNA-binding protein